MIEEQELLNNYFKREIKKLHLIIEEKEKSFDKLTKLTESLITKVTKLEVANAIESHLKNQHI